MEKADIVKCPCGHRTCDQYTLSTQRSVGFDLAPATLYANAGPLLEAAREYEAAMPLPRSKKAIAAWDKLRTIMRAAAGGRDET